MDAFYASVEQLDHPAYRGKPVVVGADPRGGSGRGVVAACSYEARKFGIRSAMPISRAYRLCPTAVFVRPRGARYAEMSERIFAILREYTDLMEPLSIDEAFLDVTASQRLFGPAAEIGRMMKARIRSELGLVASIGLAPNKFLAKVGSDLGKPDGFVMVAPGQERAFLDPLPISRLWGVGPKTEARLHQMGFQTIGQIARTPLTTLEDTLGQGGRDLWELANGLDDRPVEPEQEAKSIGAEHTFAEDTADREQIRRTILELADRVGRRLRRDEVLAGGVTLKFRDHRFHTVTRAAVAGPADGRGRHPVPGGMGAPGQGGVAGEPGAPAGRHGNAPPTRRRTPPAGQLPLFPPGAPIPGGTWRAPWTRSVSVSEARPLRALRCWRGIGKREP